MENPVNDGLFRTGLAIVEIYEGELPLAVYATGRMVVQVVNPSEEITFAEGNGTYEYGKLAPSPPRLYVIEYWMGFHLAHTWARSTSTLSGRSWNPPSST